MRIGILGAGIAGLSAGYFLRNSLEDIQIHEASGVVGGLARSFKWHGFDCDLAPHRLFTNDEQLLKEMMELVPMVKMRRRSQIFLQGRWVLDPVNAVELVWKFLPFRSWELLWTYLFRQKYAEDSFESLVLGKFGSGLNKLFFKPYSEKLFGIPAKEISASWGRRKLRVGGIKDMIRRNSKLYFKYFYYPKVGGYGAICERIHQEVQQYVRLHSRLTAVQALPDNRGYRCRFERDGETVEESFDVLITSLPLSFFAKLLGLDLKLRFRPARLTYFLLKRRQATANHWFYFADGNFLINRVAEFKNFAINGLPEDQTVICCEVTQVESYSVDKVISELKSAGVLAEKDIVDMKTIDIKQAYPIYDITYEEQMKRAEVFFANHPNIYHVGRHAQFAHKDVDEIFDDAKKVAVQVLQQKDRACSSPMQSRPRVPIRSGIQMGC
jgi:protoporphyrinogen oxidase